MITALLELRLKAEAVPESEAVIRSVLTQTRAREGNLGVDVLIDRADAAHVTIVERWESIEADTAYRAWRATDEGKSSLGTILAGPPVLTLFETAFTL
ncbi:hypothetical protein B7R54_01275 [Subtercola boreus]|uniref:ABM domain-containing protein n=1 Tax=Subtercola boreus TaxID=120213 RepID=A0A3E0VF53_9MICO|nr:antibiotic biosynthesis monooxygenase family protein [Subtercola boreus]RFA08000.1 hypothetical protein B7R54_01275 [Subtercola boreus]TQL55134.1 quinol monooxygenase YgiN [Subtercola boreus]